MKQKERFHLNIGAISILMIFVVLCLTTFAVLSFVTANADKKISTKNAKSVENYYKASARVESTLSQIDTELAAAANDAQRIVKNPIYLLAMNDSVYFENHEKYNAVINFLQSSAADEQKRKTCYDYFARCRIARISNTALFSKSNPLAVTLTEKIDSERNLTAVISVGAYGTSPRYQLVEEKTVLPRQEVSSEETLPLWQGSSAP